MSYSVAEVEKKWQEYWNRNQAFFTDLSDRTKPKKYILAMFPYPSGSGLHVGHIRNYTITDALARYYRLKGYSVLMPIGWDAFGLPAEQYAIQTGNHPANFTQKNIDNFKQQLLSLGFSYDWSKEINTSEPDYYHWTQWIFCQIYQQGLAKYKEIPVYWCGRLGTVLANEEVREIDGKKVSERGSYPVVEKKIPQWVLKITEYAPRLLADLKGLDWPNNIKTLQTNWIGLSKGTIINFSVVEGVELVCEKVMFYSPSHYDCNDFYEWVYKIKCVSRIKGMGEKVYLFVNNTKISDEDLRELLGLFRRYNIDMSQLAVFLNEDNKSWFFINYPEVFAKESKKNVRKKSQKRFIPVFTTRPDTIRNVVAITLAINHPLISEVVLPEHQLDVAEGYAYWEKWKESKELMVENFTGSYCLNPITQEEIPIWITNFVISDYGTGAVMISPYFSQEDEWDKFSSQTNLFTEQEKKQNKEIDFAFAKRHYLLRTNRKEGWTLPITEEISQKKLEEYQKDQEIKKVNQELEKKRAGKRTETYHLRDWVFSRQRYWGEPIPVIHWENNTQTLLSKNELPLELPSLKDFTPNPNYYAPLQKAENWVNIENKSGLKGKRDVNVMPQWAGSCWYYIAFLLKKIDGYLALNSQEAKEIIKNWLPVDIYIGGQEHATTHLLYARFWHKILYKIGVVSHPEPFQKLICQGIILGTDGEKMSKSRGNIVNPNELVEKYGADALRLYEIFLGPPEHTTSFDSKGVWAMKKWLDRVYNFATLYKKVILADVENEEIRTSYYEMVKKIDGYYQSIKLNLIVSSLMVFINKCYKVEKKFMRIDYFLGFLKLLNPLAPHISEELWSYFKEGSINESNWPSVEKMSVTATSQLSIVVQVNGKKKTVISVNKEKDQTSIEVIAKNSPKVKEILAGKKIIKTVFIEKKLINFVI